MSEEHSKFVYFVGSVVVILFQVVMLVVVSACAWGGLCYLYQRWNSIVNGIFDAGQGVVVPVGKLYFYQLRDRKGLSWSRFYGRGTRENLPSGGIMMPTKTREVLKCKGRQIFVEATIWWALCEEDPRTLLERIDVSHPVVIKTRPLPNEVLCHPFQA